MDPRSGGACVLYIERDGLSPETFAQIFIDEVPEAALFFTFLAAAENTDTSKNIAGKVHVLSYRPH